MDTIAPVSQSSATLWAALVALDLIEQAADAVAAAAAEARALTIDSAWQSRGAGAQRMHDAFERLSSELGADAAAACGMRALVLAGIDG